VPTQDKHLNLGVALCDRLSTGLNQLVVDLLRLALGLVERIRFGNVAAQLNFDTSSLHAVEKVITILTAFVITFSSAFHNFYSKISPILPPN